MDRGTYVAASGGVLQLRKLEVQNNNLANMNTVGFKRQFVTSEVGEFDRTFASAMGSKAPFARGDHERMPGVEGLKVVTDFSAGPIKSTGNPYDVALRDAKHFFVVNTPDGTQYTRAGNFTLNTAGELITQDGMQVQGDGGAITVTGSNPSIQADGSIRAGGVQVGRLQVVQIENPNQLEHVAGTRFKLGGGGGAPAPVEAQVVPESLEMSNVSPITGMIDLITTNRAFEAYTKAASTLDGLNQIAIDRIGRRS